ncbi:hypothetical protein PIB30_041111 [Stylosanthes scabra]|uniref:Uncharacterized protein n=1 Tax=Stylosanthes scabra TaxID=79078 RepID=A0ABU6QEI3_9FABA|nr:hypothetical protein [Stylosanthes scabra]
MFSPCVEPASIESATSRKVVSRKISVEMLGVDNVTCLLEFDGASKGNPGKANAGAILCAIDGIVVWV